MKLAIIVAQSSNRVIGRNNQLPWHLPEDLKYFKKVTMGKAIIMGRKTYESIGRPLPGRTNIIVTRDLDYSAEGVEVVHGLEAAIARAKDLALLSTMQGESDAEAMVIGGAELYQQALPQAERLYLTQVHSRVQGDAYFPEFEPGDWKQVGRDDYAADGKNPFAYSFLVLERQNP